MSLLDDILEEQDKKAPRELKNDWVSEIDGRPTFLGVMFRYYNEIIVGWNADTQKNYFWDYRRFLLPDLNSSPLKSYTKEDFEKIFSLLPERKKAFNQVYHERVLRHFWHITNRVLKIASKNNICPNVLWGSEELLPEETDEEAAEKELVRLKKSLSIQEELQIAEQILVDPNQTGQRMGLALMFCLGLRNGEACGADFQDIHPMEGHPEIDCLLVYKSTKQGSNTVKMGGKTKNMGRMIPIPSKLKSLLDQRYKLLEEKAMAGELPGYGPAEVVEGLLRNLPIACDGLDFTRRCSARLLTKEGKAVLERSSVDENVLFYISRDIRRDQEGVMEKDPTAYLLRRNFGTQLYLLGLEESEIQYIIGHEIEDPGEMRSIFRSEEKLYPIAQKMALRPIVNEIPDMPEPKYLIAAPKKVFRGQLFCHQLQIGVDGSLCLRVRISQREPGSRMRVELIPSQITFQGTHTQHENMADYEKSLSTRGLYQQKYREIMGRKKRKTEKEELEQGDCEKPV